jgi:ribonuclease HI
MYFDGAVNVAGNGKMEFDLLSPDGKEFPVNVKLRFECTNNIAEYEACVAGLQAGKKSEESGGILRFSINHFSGER